MNLLAIRDLNAEDPLPGLGPKVERPAPEPAKPAEVRPGIVVDADGKMSTNIPPPAAPFAAHAAGSSPHLHNNTNCRPYIAPPTEEPGPAPPDTDPPEAAREPLKVGDWVRLLRPEAWSIRAHAYRAGTIVQVTEIDGRRFLFGPGFGMNYLACGEQPTEGRDWVRCDPPEAA